MSEENGFYREAAVAASRRRIGAPVRPVGVASWIMALFMIGVVIVVLLFATFARFARIESIQGSLEPIEGSARIVAPRSAVVTRIHVVEGQMVNQGDPLITLGSDPVLEGGQALGEMYQDTSATQAAALNAQKEALRLAQIGRVEELAARREGGVRRAERLRADLELARQRLQLNEETLVSFSRLREQGYLSEIRYRAQEAAVLDDRRAISAISGEIDATQTGLAELEATLARLNAEARQSEANIVSSLATVEERRASALAQAAVIVTAHKAGRVTLQARQGSAVSEGGAVAVILPPGAGLRARLWATSRAAGFIQPGNDVRLLYDAFPYQRFGAGEGKVLSVASAPTDPKDIGVALSSEEALYRVDVELTAQQIQAYGRDWPLAAGSRLTGDVVLESRSLLSWILDPIRAIRERRM